jgi:hypothetical protein
MGYDDLMTIESPWLIRWAAFHISWKARSFGGDVESASHYI